MTVIKINTNNIASLIRIPEAGYSGYKSLQLLIGGSIEHVLPRRLPHPYCMIVDEEGLLKELPLNTFGSWLYQTDIHGSPIVGDILLMKDGRNSRGVMDILGLTDLDVTVLQKTFSLPLIEEGGT